MESMNNNYRVPGPTCTDPFTGGPELSQVCTANTVAVFLTILNNLIKVNPKIGDPCGRVKPTEPMETYDFIVIGAGASGAAAAARLSEKPEWKVLLLEAGPDEPAGMEIPANTEIYFDTELDWKYMTSNESHTCQANNGSCKWPRGKNLGGTTGHHGMGYHRGHAADYMRWLEWGNYGWNWTDVLPVFKKSEDNREIGRVSSDYHGTGGPMTVERFLWQPAIAKTILKAAEETGYGTTEDVVGDNITGFAIAQTMSKNGVRQSSASAFLRPIRDRKNLDIVLNATATKIVTSGKKVRGVEFMLNDTIQSVKVKHEVVISGGAVNSPQLLLLSGIGPAADLEKLGIPVVHDLPGVGKNLHNHVAYGMTFTIPESRLNFTMEDGDQYLYHQTGPSSFTGLDQPNEVLPPGDTTSDDPDMKMASMLPDPRSMIYNNEDVNRYLTNQTGPLSSNGLGQLTAILSSKYTTPDDPDIQIFFSGYKESSCELFTNKDAGTKNTVSFIAVNLRPKSRGAISLASKDPLKHPIIWSNEFADPEDIEVVIEGIHVLKTIANSTAMLETGIQVSMKPLPHCSEYDFLSDNYFRCAMKWDAASVNHPAGTCKMGPASDPMAVVDPELRVHGIEGLRVADASIMPMIISGNPHAPITMIGEQAADFIKKKHA